MSLENWSSQSCARVSIQVLIFVLWYCKHIIGFGRDRSGCSTTRNKPRRGKSRSGLKATGLKCRPKIAVKSVRTRSGKNGYDRPRSSAVLSLKTAGLYLDFRYKRDWDVVYTVE